MKRFIGVSAARIRFGLRTPLRPLLALALLGAASPPAGSTPVRVLQGRGVQIYRCGPSPADVRWTLLGPDATLYTEAGKPVGRHFAGPSWQAEDGSTVVGAVIAAGAAPAQGDAPWLVLRAKSHAGTGVFASVTIVTRSQTNGGAAPATGCDGAHLGAMARVPYTANYAFFSS